MIDPRFKIQLLVVLAAIMLSSCKLYVADPNSGSEAALVIRGGKSFGECIGYCWTELRLDGDRKILTSKKWGRESDERSFTADLSPAEWDELVAALDLSTFFSLNDVYGCPDCADGGAEWIEVKTDDGLKKVTFEYGDPPAPIEAVGLKLRDLRETAIEEAGWR